MISYQPLINEAFLEDYKTTLVAKKTLIQDVPRPSVNRLNYITKDIIETFGTAKNVSTLDIGCNSGFFSNCLSSLGADCTGIDDNAIQAVKHVSEKPINLAKKFANDFNLKTNFMECEAVKFSQKANRVYDCVILFSVIHDMFIGYGYDKNRVVSTDNVNSFLKKIFEFCNWNMYFETDYVIGKSFGWGTREEVISNFRKLFNDNNSKLELKILGQEAAYNAPRDIWRISFLKNNLVNKSKFSISKRSTGTFGNYVPCNENNFSDIIGKNFKNGSLNIETELPLNLNKKIIGKKMNYSSRLYDLSSCKLNGIEGLLYKPLFQEPNYYEFIGPEINKNSLENIIEII